MHRLGPLILFALVAAAQAPTGDIAGTVHDPVGGLVPNTRITVRNLDSGFTRVVTSNDAGAFSVPSLAPGPYEIRAEAAGFQRFVIHPTVRTGAVTSVDVALLLGGDSIEVDVTDPVDTERHTVDQVISRHQIEQLPLNGRSFLQLSFLSPGVTVSTNNQGNFNRSFDVTVLGNSPDLTRVTVDGAHINDAVDGGTQQNFSQEIVHEFQISSVNFDLSTGIAAGGAINIITRGGSNQFHGSAFFFFRDHHLSAYPALVRDPLAPDPFFARRQTGLWASGPIRRDRLFFFTSYEHNTQRAVFSSLPTDPEFRPLAALTASPFHEDLADARIDYRITDRHTAFVRYSHDSNNAFAPREVNSLPSAWVTNDNYADSGVFSLISALRPTFVNEFRYSMTYWSNQNAPPSAAICPNCFGLGGPHVIIDGAGLIFGNQTNSPQSRLVRRHIFSDNVSLQHGRHRFKFGGEVEHVKGTGTYVIDSPADFLLFSPAQVRQLAPQLAVSLPASFTTYDSVLNLPLETFAFGIGDINQPPAFQRNHADHDNLLHVYAQDTWKPRPRLTLNYGLAWSFETNVLNHDLSKPQFLAPFFGTGGLGPETHAWLRFTPALGFAWAVHGDTTVIRGGGGIYYDTLDLEARLVERAFLGPLGTGFLPLPGSLVTNPLHGVPGVPKGTPLSFTTPTIFTGGFVNLLLPTIRSTAIQELHINPDNTDLSVRNVDVFKTATDLFARDFVPAQAQHLSIGIHHQFNSHISINSDFAFRHFLHEMFRGIDLNHYYAAQGPLLPNCTPDQQLIPDAPCTNGPVQASISGGRSTYKGLLTRADLRAGRLQASIAYALQGQDDLYGINLLETPITNLNNWLQNTGPQLPRHVLNISGTIEMPWRLRLSFISSFSSRYPFQPVITGVDFYGTGVEQFLLPGGGTNQFNFGLGKADLIRLVNTYNQQYANKPGPVAGQTFPRITLPQNYDFGRATVSQDFRLTRIIRYERLEAQLFGEVFNALNIANLTGYSNNLLDPGFGQPSARATNIFGTGGPRAFQLGVRVSF